MKIKEKSEFLQIFKKALKEVLASKSEAKRAHLERITEMFPGYLKSLPDSEFGLEFTKITDYIKNKWKSSEKRELLFVTLIRKTLDKFVEFPSKSSFVFLSWVLEHFDLANDLSSISLEYLRRRVFIAIGKVFDVLDKFSSIELDNSSSESDNEQSSETSNLENDNELEDKSSKVLKIKGNIIPKLEIWLASGGSNTYLASRSTRRANINSWSIRQNSEETAFCRRNLESIGQILGKFALSNDLVWMLRLGREKDLKNYIEDESQHSSKNADFNITDNQSEISLEYEPVPQQSKAKVNSGIEAFYGKLMSQKTENSESHRSKLLKTTSHGFQYNKAKQKNAKNLKLKLQSTKTIPRDTQNTGNMSSAKVNSNSNLNMLEENKRMIEEEVGDMKATPSSSKSIEIKNNLRKVLSKLPVSISKASLTHSNKKIHPRDKNFISSKHSICSKSSKSQSDSYHLFNKMRIDETLEDNAIIYNKRSSEYAKIPLLKNDIASNLNSSKANSKTHIIYEVNEDKIRKKLKGEIDGNKRKPSDDHCFDAIKKSVIGNQKSNSKLLKVCSNTQIKESPPPDYINENLLIQLISKVSQNFDDIWIAFRQGLYYKIHTKAVDHSFLKTTAKSLSNSLWLIEQIIKGLEKSLTSPEQLQIFMTLLSHASFPSFAELQKCKFFVTLVKVRQSVSKLHGKENLIFTYMKIVHRLLIAYPEHRVYFLRLFIVDEDFLASIEMILRNTKSFEKNAPNEKCFSFERRLIKFWHTSILHTHQNHLINCRHMNEELYRGIAYCFEIRMHTSVEGGEYILGRFLKFLADKSIKTDDEITLFLMIIKIFGKSIPFLQDKLAKCFYLRILYLYFLKLYCKKENTFIEEKMMKAIVNILINLASLKSDEELMSAFKQLRVLQFFGKEIDLEYEIGFILANTSKSTKVKIYDKKNTSEKKSLLTNVQAFNFEKSNTYGDSESSRTQSEFQVFCYDVPKTNEIFRDSKKYLTVDNQGQAFVVKNYLTEENQEDLRIPMLHRKTEPNIESGYLLQPNLEYFESDTKDFKEKSQKLSLALKLDLVNSPSIQKQSSSFSPYPNSQEKKIYQKLRTFRKLYNNVKFHQKFIELILVLLLNRSLTSLSEEFTGQYPIQSGKQNYIFLLVRHLSHEENDLIFKQLYFSLQKRIAKLMFKASIDSSKSEYNNGFEAKMMKLFPSMYQETTKSSVRDIKEDCSFSIKENCDEKEGVRYKENVNPHIKNKIQLLKSVQILLKCLKMNSGLSPSIGHKINTGAFSVVNEAQILQYPLFAIKNVQAENSIFDRNSLFYLFNEIAILNHIKDNPNALSEGNKKQRSLELIDFHLSPTGQYMLLFPRLQSRDRTTGDIAASLKVFNDIVNQINLLHQQGITHYDIKGDNIMKEEKRHILVDYGESLQGEQSFRLRGTEYIRSPEMLNSKLEAFEMEQANSGRNYNEMVGLYNRQSRFLSGPASDIWALGCLLFELITNQMLFYEKDWTVFFDRVTSENAEILTDKDLKRIGDNYFVKTLLEFMLSRNPQQRPNIQTLSKKLKAVCKILEIDIDNSQGESFELNLDLPELLKSQSSNDKKRTFFTNDLEANDFSDPAQSFCGQFWLSPSLCFDCADLSAISNDTDEHSYDKYNHYVLDLTNDEKVIWELAKAETSSKSNISIEKWLQHSIQVFWKILRSIRIAKAKRQQIMCIAPSGFLAALLGPILLSIKTAKLRFNTILEVQIKSFYKIKYSNNFILLISKLWEKLRAGIKKFDNYKLIECPCKSNCLFIYDKAKVEEEICECSFAKNDFEIWNCNFRRCSEYREMIYKKHGIYTEHMKWIRCTSSDIVGATCKEPMEVLGYLSDDLKIMTSVFRKQTVLKLEAELTEAIYCSECKCVILIQDLASKQVSFPSVNIRDNAKPTFSDHI